LTLPDLKSTPPILVTSQLLSSTYHLYDDVDKDTFTPDIMLLTVEEHNNTMLLLETVITSIDAIDSDLGLNKDADIDLLDLLDNNLQRFDKDDPVYSLPKDLSTISPVLT
jgi:hypothetical protein